MVTASSILAIITLAGVLLVGESFSLAPNLPKRTLSVSSTACHSTRRSFLLEQTVAVTSSAAAFLSIMPPAAVNALEEEDNEFIQELKSRSEANKERYKKEGQTGKIGPNKIDYTQKSKYSKPKYIGIRRLDGSYKMVNPEVAEEWKKQGLVIAEYDTFINKEGIEKPDYRKGLILQFKDKKSQAQADSKKPTKAPSPAPSPAPVAPGPAPVTSPPAPVEPAPAPAPSPAVSEEPKPAPLPAPPVAAAPAHAPVISEEPKPTPTPAPQPEPVTTDEAPRPEPVVSKE